MPKADKTDLRHIPGVGKNMEEHLVRLGYTSVDSLKGQDPEAMYEEDCRKHGGYLDRWFSTSTAAQCTLQRMNGISRKSSSGGTGRIEAGNLFFSGVIPGGAERTEHFQDENVE